MKCKTGILFFLILFFSGCEKVIDVDLNEANPVVVIEANLSNSPVLVEVRISKTGSYFGEIPVSQVSNATVTVEDDLGNRHRLFEQEPGLYISRDVYPQAGRTYRLAVEVDGKSYEAVSRLNPPVPIDSITLFYDEGFAFIDEGYYPKLYFTDPVGTKNYYRIKVYKNESFKNRLDNFVVLDDRLIDGHSLEITLRQRTFRAGQEVKVELISLDKGAYDYLNSFRELISVNPGSAAPANPVSNFSNGALGYFSAWSSDVKILVVKE